MKRIIALVIAIIVLLCSLSLPSFAVDYTNFSCEIINDEIIITKYIGTNKTSITVPTTLDGKPVVAIADGAFKGNTELTTVKVNEGIRDIGASAFEDCTSLSTITLPTTITHIGEKAIYNTAYYNNVSNWKKQVKDESSGGIGFGNGMPQISWEDIAAQELEYLYLGTNLIEISFIGSYSLKSGTRVIADGAFAGSKAERVTLSNTLVTIGNNAFKDCVSLKEIVFIDAIETIGDYAFEGCTALKTINLPDKYIEMNSSSFYNTGYYNNERNWDGDILYSGNHLIAVKDNPSFIEVKDGTKYVVGNTLSNNVYITESVKKISNNAFDNNTNATIFGYADTYAHSYATTNNIKFVDMSTLIKGDLDVDGKISRDDYEILCQIATSMEKPNLVEKIVGDMDDDGALDGIDVIILDLMLKDMPPSRLKGDVNGDNKVDVDDYDLLVKIVSTKEKITDNVMFQRADINEDGAVDAHDAIYLDLALNGIVALI
ncbi:MAG: leucine-rich repeat protein [Clostridia bacterium]|nr:leucine-rich repeat protein [Clostridia bacterium]